MYLPDLFHEQDVETIAALIEAHPLGALTRIVNGAIVADHIPFLFDAKANVLRAHVARANPLWRDFDFASEALAIFTGLDHYVTPSWYATKRETGKVVPTWNYEAVHVYGRLRAIEDANWIRALLRDLTARHESPRPAPWALEDAPDDFIDAMSKAIVGIELSITRIEAKRKLSQNRNAADRAGVIAGLEAEGGETAERMAKAMAALDTKA
ncbi:FMN-binding negative transcriptional regulator [Methylosinus sp. KRF6]|uniref:FMN-binding negative transcriptional regulator n=1 Tax=Methylosinus sp. KRF6 TaxID=2846853 RepID=UPI001C0BE512|nr:FMN-binding negative transcriptional regulator [Methylosinus sp. KRF6]MBU3887574.1 FMN-binding negative transcriptional regulator [Methylosinus sp. KRF6]